MYQTLAVDFDGVIHAYSKGWHDGTIYDPPVEGALEALRTLMADHPVFIFTTRDVGQVARWLIERGFSCHVGHDGPFWNELGRLLVTNRKLAAAWYIDDRAVRFVNWPQTLKEVGSDWTDLGDGHGYRFSRWSPDRDLNPQYDGIPDVERYAAMVRHTTPTGKPCMGAVTFDGDVARRIEPGKPTWTLESWDPLTISPSLLCKCGDHGFIREGKWVRA